MQADRSHLPLKVNTAGVIPPIFASSLLLMPLTVTQMMGQNVQGDTATGDFLITLNQYLAHGQPLYMALYAAGIIFFCFFYVAVVFNPEETARSEEHTSELQSLMRISYAVFCLKKKKYQKHIKS